MVTTKISSKANIPFVVGKIHQRLFSYKKGVDGILFCYIFCFAEKLKKKDCSLSEDCVQWYTTDLFGFITCSSTTQNKCFLLKYCKSMKNEVSASSHLYLLLCWTSSRRRKASLTIEFAPIFKQMRSVSEYKYIQFSFIALW